MKLTKSVRKASGRMLAADEKAYLALRPHMDSLPVRAISRVGSLGDQPELRLLAGATGLLGLVTRNKRLIRAALRMVLAHEAATIAKDAVKQRVDRHRPQKAKKKADRKVKNGKHTDHDVTSFPSGRSAGSIAVALAFSREFPEHGTKAIAAAGIIAAAQVPKCSHYITDVVAGLAIGILAEAATEELWQKIELQDSGASSVP